MYINFSTEKEQLNWIEIYSISETNAKKKYKEIGYFDTGKIKTRVKNVYHQFFFTLYFPSSSSCFSFIRTSDLLYYYFDCYSHQNVTLIRLKLNWIWINLIWYALLFNSLFLLFSRYARIFRVVSFVFVLLPFLKLNHVNFLSHLITFIFIGEKC